MILYTYAQIVNNLVANTIAVSADMDPSMFQEGYDYLLRVDNLSPQPGIGWGYDGESFTPPAVQS